MTLLLWLTLVYAAVLVLVLAAGLILVWVRLRRIAGALGEARASLVRVRDGSAGLSEAIDPLRDRLLSAFSALEEAAEDLEGAAERVAGTGAAAGGAR